MGAKTLNKLSIRMLEWYLIINLIKIKKTKRCFKLSQTDKKLIKWAPERKAKQRKKIKAKSVAKYNLKFPFLRKNNSDEIAKKSYSNHVTWKEKE